MAWRFDAIDAMPSPSPCLLDGVESRNTLGSTSAQVFADESRWRLAATDDVALQIRPQTDAAEAKRYYRSCGRLVAKALFDGQVLPQCRLARPLLKHILALPVTFDDLE